MKPGFIKLFITILILGFWYKAFSQPYYPLPETNAFWSVNEFDESKWIYNDIIYSVRGDTIINGLNYTRVFKMDDYPSIYDTVSTLHCFMRQDIPARKVYFIRYYLGETEERLGYDFSAAIGDTVSLPAFDYGNVGDSIFIRQEGYCDSIQLLNGEYRRMYFYFSPFSDFSHQITFVEGVSDYNSTFPNRISEYDAFHQTFSICAQVDGEFTWSWYSPADSTKCGFNYLGTNKLSSVSGFSVCPNPAAFTTLASFPVTTENGSLCMADLTGNVIQNLRIFPGKSSLLLDLTNYAPGMYILYFRTSEFCSPIKLIVWH